MQVSYSADTIWYSSALYFEIITRTWTSNPSAANILAYYHWAMVVLIGDFHPSELERLDKPCGKARLELATIRS